MNTLSGDKGLEIEDNIINCLEELLMNIGNCMVQAKPAGNQ